MTLFKDKYRVESIRLPGYDYSQPGAYFITIVTHNRQCFFGNIIDGEMMLNEFGVLVKNEWLKTGIIRPNIVIDAFVVMPNHLHVIIIITDTKTETKTIEQFGKPTKNSIPTIVRLFKSTTTKQINQLRVSTPMQPLWQRNYYEHVIRNKVELNRIRQYIIDNPKKWKEDNLNKFL